MKKDKLRQYIGENFLNWVDENYSHFEAKQLSLNDIYNRYKNNFPIESQYISFLNFCKRLKFYRQWKGGAA